MKGTAVRSLVALKGAPFWAREGQDARTAEQQRRFFGSISIKPLRGTAPAARGQNPVQAPGPKRGNR